MNATVILYMLFLLLKLSFPTILCDIDPNDLPKLGLNINALRGFYYHFPYLLPPPTTMSQLKHPNCPIHVIIPTAPHADGVFCTAALLGAPVSSGSTLTLSSVLPGRESCP